MSEYLEAFESIMKIYGNTNSLEGTYNYFLIIKKALHRLEAIDNSNPSEALKKLEMLSDCAEAMKELPKSNWIEYADNEAELDYQLWRAYEDLKQSLLKAQEPKHYLKWEDLEFNHKAVFTEAKLGETIYDLVIGFDCTGKETIFLRTDNQQIVFHEKDKQFFNDLHLERVEE